MDFSMQINKRPDDEDRAEVKHAREIDALKDQCRICKSNKPNTPTKDCAIKIKLTIEDSEVAWKHRHLFLNGNKCKMFLEK